MNFDDIAYLQFGNAKQQQAYRVLTQHSIMLKLLPYDPILVGTVPIGIDIDNSDLDIICYYTNQQSFSEAVIKSFHKEKNFKLSEYNKQGTTAIVASFSVEQFLIEVFGQNIPTRQQYAYRHMLVEHRILMQKGATFRQQVIELKRQGFKTEPAFGILLGFKDDPYTELLNYDADGIC